jgi:predicted GNAT family acetyltransferase
MTTSADEIDVVDIPEESRYVVRLNGVEAELVYQLHGDRFVLVHTGVPEELGGRGIGGRLVATALERARAEHLTVVPWCPFATRWLRDHPDATAGVAIDWSARPPASR